MGTVFQPVDVELLRVAGITRVETVEPVSGGFVNEVFRVNNRVVLRRWTRPGAAQLELAAIEEAGKDGIPVPEVLAAAGERAVLSWVDGVRADLVPQDRALGRTLGELIRKVTERRREAAGELTWNRGWHVTPWPAAGTEMLAELVAGATDAPPGWAELARAHEVGLVTAPVRVHGDLNPKNVLLRPDGAVAALLDWEFTFAGPRETDLGNLLRFEPRDEPPTPFALGVREGAGADDEAVQRGRELDLFSLAQFLAPRKDTSVRRRVRALAEHQVATGRI